jgi:hypothetical protein
MPGRRKDNLCGPRAREQAAESSVKGAQLGLGRRRLVVAVVVRRPRLILVLVRGQKIAEVPYRVRERRLLRGEQQANASQLQ